MRYPRKTKVNRKCETSHDSPFMSDGDEISAWHFRRLVFKTLMVTQTLTASNATLKECIKRDVRVFIARPPRRPSSGAAVAPSSSRPVRASPRVYPRAPTLASPTREPPRSIRPGPPLDRAVGARLWPPPRRRRCYSRRVRPGRIRPPGRTRPTGEFPRAAGRPHPPRRRHPHHP